MVSIFLYAPGIQGSSFYFASQKRSIPFRLAALRDRSRSHTHFAPIPLHLRKVSSHAGAMVLTLNFKFSARPEGTLSQSEATERIFNYSNT